ncbi:MAG: FtsX-like permease family protein [Candidatus Goldbacteria bacterium]|nr:FtsX-like permease family protein [Candidatus Goldiibacteriota bacterium]
MNLKIIKIAFNNLLKHSGRTIFNLFTFATNALALIVLLGMLKGMYNEAFERTIALDTGHFKIYHKDYITEKEKMPLDKNIKNPYEVIKSIENVPYFICATPRIKKYGILSNTLNKTNVIITGIDMNRELQTMNLFKNLKKENYLGNGGEILVGKRLAELMKSNTGDLMLIYSQTQHKANNLMDVTLKGIYSIGFAVMEKMIVYIPFDFAQQFFDMPDCATEIIIKIQDKKFVPFVKSRIENILKEKYPELILRDWTQEAEGLIAGVQADFISYGILFAILLIMAVSIIMNTLTITVFERTAEIGTLRAIGLTKGQIRWMFLWEGILLSLGGAIIGGIIVLPIVYYLNIHGMTMPPEIMDKMPYPFESLKSKNEIIDWFITYVICIITGIIGAILPANRAAGTNVVDALKKGVR